ncbi:IS21 family transposase [Plantactinospora sp. BC1]|uniref:IS21 family transposase n=1 Tax=Plantactinospora sp. BC1 TaxID=2108470 RepID=UPI000D17BA2F|nr:IS21 family transposase [Plantactinospora sp. BC1]AVT31295.1 IS21 family transposase [Plantactinospora sp. BC1]
MRPRLELFEAIRRDARREELSIRALAERHGVHRRTVRQALASAVPVPRKPRVAQAPKLDPVRSVIDQMLVADLTAPRKQRHTARRIHARLVEEHGAHGLSYSTVRDYVRRRRPEIAASAGRSVQTAFVVQSHAPGAEAEVDFGDVWVEVAGEKLKCFLFAFRLSYSGKAVHRVFASQGQEAFIEGHVHAFTAIGGVPTDKIRYDNLRSAVSRVLLGRNRTESEHWVAFRSHYGFDPFYCMPGIEGAHEKGGVEGEVGRFRRMYLSPIPVVNSLAELNERIDAADRADDARRIAGRVRTVGQDFAVEAPLLASLPSDDFEPGLWLYPRVDRFGQVAVRCCYYSVPASLIGRQVRVCLRASELIVFDGRREVARHARSVNKGSRTLLLDHYLEVFARKPGALPGAVALAQARKAGMFTTAHDAFWGQARRTLGDAGGTRALVEVLLLHRHLPHADVVAGIEAALRVGTATVDVVAVEARKSSQERCEPHDHLRPEPSAAGRAARVVSLTERRLADPGAVIGGLPRDPRPLPSVAHYDELLKLRRTASPPSSGPPAETGRVS